MGLKYTYEIAFLKFIPEDMMTEITHAPGSRKQSHILFNENGVILNV